MSELLTVGTDGSCLTNPGFAGWAWVVDDERWRAGSLGHATNQIAELSAILHAVTELPLDAPLLVISDSQYAIKCATIWLPSWKRNGWKTKGGDPVKNQDIIRGIDDMLAERKALGGNVKFEWVRGHQGHALNESADYRCGSAARAVRDGAADGSLHGPGWGQPLSPATQARMARKKSQPEDLRLSANWASR